MDKCDESCNEKLDTIISLIEEERDEKKKCQSCIVMLKIKLEIAVVIILGFVAIFAICFANDLVKKQVCCSDNQCCLEKKFDCKGKIYCLPRYFNNGCDKYEVESSIFYASNTNPKFIVGKYKSNDKKLYCGIWLNDNSTYHPNSWFYLPELLKTTEDFDALFKSFKSTNKNS